VQPPCYDTLVSRIVSRRRLGSGLPSEVHRAELTRTHQAQVPRTIELRGSTLLDNESGLGLPPAGILHHGVPERSVRQGLRTRIVGVEGLPKV
jgi:hypothetical protein